MLGPFGEALVLDWGMAKVLSQPELGRERPAGAADLLQRVGGNAGRHGHGLAGVHVARGGRGTGRRCRRADRRLPAGGHAVPHPDWAGRRARAAATRRSSSWPGPCPPPSPRRLRPEVPRGAGSHLPQGDGPPHRRTATPAPASWPGTWSATWPGPVLAYREPTSDARLALVQAAPPRARPGGGGRPATGCNLAGAGLVYDARKTVEATRIRAEEEVQRAKEKEDEAQRRPSWQDGSDQARRDLAEFRRLAEERHFYADGTTPTGMATVYYDSRRGRGRVRQAINLADRLAPGTGRPAAACRAGSPNTELHALLLLTAQAEVRQPPDLNAVPAILNRLERAASLGRRLAQLLPAAGGCHRALGDEGAGRRGASSGRRRRRPPPWTTSSRPRTTAPAPATPARSPGTTWTGGPTPSYCARPWPSISAPCGSSRTTSGATSRWAAATAAWARGPRRSKRWGPVLPFGPRVPGATAPAAWPRASSALLRGGGGPGPRPGDRPEVPPGPAPPRRPGLAPREG